jgi:predicted metal-dependent hydrolase
MRKTTDVQKRGTKCKRMGLDGGPVYIDRMSTLTVRKLNVDLSEGFPRHWMGGDVYRTAFMNALSMSFPLGEQMFIDSVRAAPLGALVDPALRAEVKDFVGQEASHRFVHQQYNAELARQGFDYTMEAKLKLRVARIGRLPLQDRLAITCALEHYTAMLADYVLRHPAWLDGADPRLRILWNWHAAEELEHKAVAFDVYRAAGGGYWKRALWYLHVSLAFWLDTSRQTVYNLRHDRAVWRLGTWTSAARTWFGRRGLAWSLLKPGLSYLSPRFHPWRHDNRALLQMWLERNDDAYRTIGSMST